MNILLSICISVIAAFIYDIIKRAYINRPQESDDLNTEYSKKTISSIRKEFYIGFIFGIIFISIPNFKIQVINDVFNILSYFSFFVALMGFMCLDEAVKYFFNHHTHN